MRAVFFIAQKSVDGRKVGIKEIAAGIDSPEPFIAKILQDLSKRGLIQSAKGPNGGFYAEAAEQRGTLAEVVRAIDGDRLFTGCGMGLKFCSEVQPCPLHAQFAQVRDQLAHLLNNTTIMQFNEQLNMGLAYIKER